VQWVQDKEDGEEYLYSESEPFNQHIGFPCFDQPDLKAEMTFMAVAPKSWIVRANALPASEPILKNQEQIWSEIMRDFNIVDEETFLKGFGDEEIHCF
jgi:aminopeptidase N